MIAIAAFVLQEVAAPGTDIFEHTFFNIEKELIEEVRGRCVLLRATMFCGLLCHFPCSSVPQHVPLLPPAAPF